MKDKIGHFFFRVEGAVCSRFYNLVDLITDKRICGHSLVKYVPSLFRDDKNGVGMTGTQSTHYVILKRIFSHVNISDQDSFLDVGCGKGRVLAYLIDQQYKCALSGIEINEISSQIALNWAKKYPSISIIQGDAFQHDLNHYTVFFLGRPFLPITFLQFIEYLESCIDHPIQFIYWVDQQSGFLLASRKGWTIHFREKLIRIHGIKISTWPQWYSIWTYDPAKVTEDSSEVQALP